MPGAASVKAANYIYSIGPQDGTLIGIPNHAVPMNAFVWREVGDGLDVTKLKWIGRLDAIDVVNVAWHTAGVNSIEAEETWLAIAATSPTGTSVMMPTAMNRLIGTQFKVVQGYKGTAEQYLAMEKSETEGMGRYPGRSSGVRIRTGSPKRSSCRFIRMVTGAPPAWKMCRLRRNSQNEEDRKVFRLLGSTAKSAVPSMLARKCRRSASLHSGRLLAI